MVAGNFNSSKADLWINDAPIIYIDFAFYVFGGYTNVNPLDPTIGRLDDNLVWNKVGNMRRGRRAHNVIPYRNYALVIGGYGGESEYTKFLPTEKCVFSSGGVNCMEQNPILYGYRSVPALFIVPPNFCI